MFAFLSSMRVFCRKKRGAGSVEYGLLVGLIAVICLSAISAVGENQKNVFYRVVCALENALNTSLSAACIDAGEGGGAGEADSTPPTITSVTSSSAGNVVGTGICVPLTVHFSEAVAPTSTATLMLKAGDRQGRQAYPLVVTAGNPTQGTATYCVAVGDGVMGQQGALSVTGVAGIADTAGNAASDPASAVDAGVSVDGVAPQVTGVWTDFIPPMSATIPTMPSTHAYGVGETIYFMVKFFEPVMVGPNVRLPITVGSMQKYATNPTMIDDGTAYSFSYTVVSGDEDPNGITVASALDPNGAAGDFSSQIQDRTGNRLDDWRVMGSLVGEATIPPLAAPSSCAAILLGGQTANGVYDVAPGGTTTQAFQAYCLMNGAAPLNGGWMLVADFKHKIYDSSSVPVENALENTAAPNDDTLDSVGFLKDSKWQNVFANGNISRIVFEVKHGAGMPYASFYASAKKASIPIDKICPNNIASTLRYTTNPATNLYGWLHYEPDCAVSNGDYSLLWLRGDILVDNEGVDFLEYWDGSSWILPTSYHQVSISPQWIRVWVQ